jgi:hypothetical protein
MTLPVHLETSAITPVRVPINLFDAVNFEDVSPSGVSTMNTSQYSASDTYSQRGDALGRHKLELFNCLDFPSSESREKDDSILGSITDELGRIRSSPIPDCVHLPFADDTRWSLPN